MKPRAARTPEHVAAADGRLEPTDHVRFRRPEDVVQRIVGWYVHSVYRRFEGPGTVPYYCDPARVGHMAVNAQALARGEADALFRLLIVLAMYQSRRDVDVMRRQREMPARDARVMASAAHLAQRVASGRCELLRDAALFDAKCSVRRVFPAGHATCDFRPRTPCHVKQTTMAIGRMGDLGKYPTSAWLHVGRGGGLPAAYDAACRAHDDPGARASALVESIAGIYHVGRKLATMYVSALSTPELVPGLTPWAPAVGGSSLVIVDANVARVVDRLTPAGSPKTYSAREAWVRRVAATIHLEDFDPSLPSCSPRFVQQALYSFRSRANRAARHDRCATARNCPDCVVEVCPFQTP